MFKRSPPIPTIVESIFADTIARDLPVITPEMKIETNSIMRINAKRFKEDFGPDWAQTAATIIHLDKYDTPLASIKIKKIDNTTKSQHSLFTHTNKLVTLSFKDNAQPPQHFLINDKHPLSKSLQTLLENIPEEYLEKTVHKHHRKSTQPHSPEFWNGIWGNNPGMEAMYDFDIDVMTVETFEKEVLDKQNKNTDITVMDVGGGKGRIAKKLLTAAYRKNVALNYILIEPAHAQCEMAQKTLEPLINAMQKKLNSKIKIIENTFDEFLQSDLAQDLQGKIDVIISSGGPINIDVVNLETAKINITGMRKMIAPDGVMIAVGKTDLLLTRKDLEKSYQFNVLKSARRQINEDPYDNDDEKVNLSQCYVLKPK